MKIYEFDWPKLTRQMKKYVERGEYKLDNGKTVDYRVNVMHALSDFKFAQIIYGWLTNSEHFDYDSILGIGYRGSAIAAVMSQMNKKPFGVVTTEPLSLDESDPGISSHILEDSRALLVDATFDTGMTLQTAVDRLNIAGIEFAGFEVVYSRLPEDAVLHAMFTPEMLWGDSY